MSVKSSPPRSMALSGNAACSLTEVSFRLLEHYLLETASMLATGTPAFNPFLTCVIPRAYCDSTLMHSILATSAAHLSYKLGDGGNPVIVEAAMRKHYLEVVRDLQHDIASCHLRDGRCISQLLLILAFLCHYEVP